MSWEALSATEKDRRRNLTEGKLIPRNVCSGSILIHVAHNDVRLKDFI
jgi:hypothetical protein